jgi:hypothetical protein
LTPSTSVLNASSELRNLDFAEKTLTAFPLRQLLQATHLQTLRLSVHPSGGEFPKKSAGALAAMGRQLEWVAQGNRSAKVVVLGANDQPAQALCTKDLDPCLAIMIFQPGLAMLMHVDHPGQGGAGATSVVDILLRHIKQNEPQTQIALVGCNSQGSAGNFRGVLHALDELQLGDAIVMASIGNGHSSCAMDLATQSAYVGFG